MAASTDHNIKASATGRTHPATNIGNPLPARSRLAVIVPCYNEAESIRKLVSGLERLSVVVDAAFCVEFVLVDDGSSDDTWNLLVDQFAGQRNVLLVKHEINQGIAAAIATGIASTDAPFVASIDADCTYDPALISDMAAQMTDSVDMVVASPYHPAGCVEGVPRWRLGLSRCASQLYRMVLRNKLHTYTSCVRVCRREAVAHLRVKNPGFVGVVELLWALDIRGGRIIEYPARLSVREFGYSKMHISYNSFAHLRFLIGAATYRVLRRKPHLSR